MRSPAAVTLLVGIFTICSYCYLGTDRKFCNTACKGIGKI